jgi:hypothetical protein
MLVKIDDATNLTGNVFYQRTRTDGRDTGLVGALLNAYAVNIIEEASNLTPKAVVPMQLLTFGIELRYHF